MEPTDDRRRAAPPLTLVTERRTERDRRRPRWAEFRRAYRGILAVIAVALAVLLAADAWLIYKRGAYAAEVERLRGGMTDVERQRTDLILASSEKRLEVMVELLRRQARQDEALHLAVAVDSGRVHLERDGAILRTMQVEVGAERLVGKAPDTVRLAAPRGKRTVQQVLAGDAAWPVPGWVWGDRGLPEPPAAEVAGALGAGAVVLDGGTVIYARPATGPLADAAYVLPGSLRVSADDLRAIGANLKPGTAVYFY